MYLLSIFLLASNLAASTLRDLAALRGFQIGSFVEHDPLMTDQTYRTSLAREFNMITVGVYLSEVRPEESVYHFERADRLVRFAIDNGMRVRLHPLVWWNGISPKPEWILKYRQEPEKLAAILKDHLKTVVGHFHSTFPDQTFTYDVVNEPLDSLGSGFYTDSIWSLIHPADPVQFIEDAFQWAHEADPTARLFLNEIFTERSDEKFRAFVRLAQRLKSKNIPIHGIGMQMHQFLPVLQRTEIDFPGLGMALAVNPSKIEQRLAALERVGLEVHFTEMDIPIFVGKRSDPLFPRIRAFQLRRQAQLYEGYVRACVRSSICKAAVIWGFSDKYSWIPTFFSGFGEALIFDQWFSKKQAYFGVARALGR